MNHIKNIMILGERRSGTTWLEIVLRDCLKVENVFCVHMKYGNKHWPTDPFCFVDYTDDTLFVKITKHAYSWLPSLYRNPAHLVSLKNATFDYFVKQPCVSRTPDGVFVEQFENVIQCRNAKNVQYADICGVVTNFEAVLYESFLVQPRKFVHYLSNKYSIPISDKPDITHMYMGKPNTPFVNSEYYTQLLFFYNYMKLEETFDRINNELDMDQEQRLGYIYPTWQEWQQHQVERTHDQNSNTNAWTNTVL